MFGIAIDLFMQLLPLILSFFAGAAAMFAAVVTFVSNEETANAERGIARHRMELDKDQEHIDKALAIANS